VFELSSDYEKRVIFIKLAGFWNTEEMQRFEDAMRVEMRKFSSSNLQFDVLANLVDFGPQSKEVSEAHRLLMEYGKENGLRKSANIVSSTLAKMQFTRLAANETFQFFAAETAARAWLGITDD
jgi:hypothetical protein